MRKRFLRTKVAMNCKTIKNNERDMVKKIPSTTKAHRKQLYCSPKRACTNEVARALDFSR